MKYCPACGKELDDGVLFCVSCGSRQQQVTDTAAMENNTSTRQNSIHTPIVPILILWAFDIFFVVVYAAGLFNGLGFSVPAVISMGVPLLILSSISFKKSKMLYATDNSLPIQTIYAISNILLVISAILAFAGFSGLLAVYGINIGMLLVLAGLAALLLIRRKRK